MQKKQQPTCINCMNHILTQDQINNLKKRFGIKITPVELIKENYPLFMILSNLDGSEDLEKKALELANTISKYDYCIMPIGGNQFFVEFCMTWKSHFEKGLLLPAILISKTIKQYTNDKRIFYKFKGFCSYPKDHIKYITLKNKLNQDACNGIQK